MQGTVVHHEYRIGYIVIRDNMNEYTVAELINGDVAQKGDIVEGNLRVHGDAVLYNLTKGELLQVYIKALECQK